MEQITIITKDYHGLTADITSALGSNDINIKSLDAKKIDDIGLVMLRVNQCVLGDGVPTGVTQDAQGAVVLVHPEHHQAYVVDLLCVK
jgi:hypothetical protein